MARTTAIVLMLWLMAADCIAQHARGSAEREIVDPSTGTRWFLVRDASHPGGPGKLVVDEVARVRLPIAVRAGEAVVVEEHSDRVDLNLQGVALSPAEAGGSLAVRLRIGGRVVQARAVAPGRVELAGEGKGR